ncbi:hypothetical protein HBB16_01385 [Pseudonocardia sp. MCCB 268]|nr:hypothetical protein [Pseudonocardia cytotoxica]
MPRLQRAGDNLGEAWHSRWGNGTDHVIAEHNQVNDESPTARCTRYATQTSATDDRFTTAAPGAVRWWVRRLRRSDALARVPASARRLAPRRCGTKAGRAGGRDGVPSTLALVCRWFRRGRWAGSPRRGAGIDDPGREPPRHWSSGPPAGIPAAGRADHLTAGSATHGAPEVVATVRPQAARDRPAPMVTALQDSGLSSAAWPRAAVHPGPERRGTRDRARSPYLSYERPVAALTPLCLA